MEQLAAASGIKHRTDWAARQSEPKVEEGYLKRLVTGAMEMGGEAERC